MGAPNLDFPIMALTTGQQVFEQQLVLGYSLHWFDQVRGQGLIQLVFPLDFLEYRMLIHLLKYDTSSTDTEI